MLKAEFTVLDLLSEKPCYFRLQKEGIEFCHRQITSLPDCTKKTYKNVLLEWNGKVGCSFCSRILYFMFNADDVVSNKILQNLFENITFYLSLCHGIPW